MVMGFIVGFMFIWLIHAAARRSSLPQRPAGLVFVPAPPPMLPVIAVGGSAGDWRGASDIFGIDISCRF
jgi:hypothetical protein